MRFEHGSHRTECLAALIVLLLLLCCCCSSSDDRRPSPFRNDELSQCLPLDEGVEPWDNSKRRRNLRFCDHYETARLLRDECDPRGLDYLIRMDEQARQVVSQFGRIIDRYDCENANSVSWTCRDCEVSPLFSSSYHVTLSPSSHHLSLPHLTSYSSVSFHRSISRSENPNNTIISIFSNHVSSKRALLK